MRGIERIVENHKEAVTAAIALSIIEWLVFGVNLGKMGNYLDEWISFGKFHFASQNLLDLIVLFFNDPRVIVRPLEALHYPVIYFFVQEKPLLYHVVNFFFELAAAIFVFLFVRRLVADARFCFAVAALFILWPSHDSTHYSIVASSINVAATFFMWSLLVCLQAVQDNKPKLNIFSGLLFLTSLLHYEFALPLALIYPCLWLYFNSSSQDRLKSFCLSLAPYTVVALVFVVYRARVLPALSIGWNYQTTTDTRYFIKVLCTGLGQNFAPESWAFFYSLASANLHSLTWLNGLILVLLLLTAGFAFGRLKSADISSRSLWFVCLLALIIVPLSYVVYGFSTVHMPRLDNHLNRVNMGSSIGMSLLVPATICLILKLLKQRTTGKIFIATSSAVIFFLAIVCLQYSVPWLVSWQAQKQVQAVLLLHKEQLLASNSLLLLDVTRYIEWAPVYDGIWDFQSTCRIVTANPNFKATVFTERLFAADAALEDKLGPSVLAALPYQKMLIFQASTGQWTSINSKSDFDRFVQKNHLVINGCK